MTCIVGMEHEGRVWLGSDAFSGNDDLRDRQPGPKWIVRPSFILGYAGMYRPAQVLEHHGQFRRRRTGEDPEKYLVSCVATEVRRVLKEHEVRYKDFVALVGCGGCVFRLQEDLSLVRSARGYDAIGAGESAALGAFAMTWRTRSENTEAYLQGVLGAAAEVCSQVSRPFFVRPFGRVVRSSP